MAPEPKKPTPPPIDRSKIIPITLESLQRLADEP